LPSKNRSENIKKNLITLFLPDFKHHKLKNRMTSQTIQNIHTKKTLTKEEQLDAKNLVDDLRDYMEMLDPEVVKITCHCSQEADRFKTSFFNGIVELMKETMIKMIASDITLRMDKPNTLLVFISDKYPILSSYINKIVVVKVPEVVKMIDKKMIKIKERQLARKELYKNLPCDMGKGNSKLAHFINHCGRFVNEDFKTEEDEHQAMKMLVDSKCLISKADAKKHGSKWLMKFVYEFGCWCHFPL